MAEPVSSAVAIGSTSLEGGSSGEKVIASSNRHRFSEVSVTPTSELRVQRTPDDDKTPSTDGAKAADPQNTPAPTDTAVPTAGGTDSQGSTEIQDPVLTVKTYSGATLADVAGALPEESGLVEFDFSVSTQGEPATSASLKVTQTMTLPQWAERDQQCPAVQKAWDNFAAALRSHEDGHVAIDKREFATAHKKFVGKSSSAIQTVSDQLRKDVVKIHEEYDTKTDHGRKGTPPTIIDLTADCKDAGKKSSDATTPTETPDGTEVMAKSSLTVGAPDDPYEQEADRIAEEVVRMETPSSPSRLMRAAQRKATNEGPSPQTASPLVDQVLSSGGRPLDTSVREYMEPRFGHDFSSVRVHTDEMASESAQSVNALAYTVGGDVVFARGQYAPETTAGRRLLAHELTHTIQQGAITLSPSIQRENLRRFARPKEDVAVLGLGSASPGTIQRDTPVATPAPTLIMGGLTVSTFDGLLSANRLVRSQLSIDAAEVPAGEPSRTSADDLVKQALGWEPFLQGKGTQPLDDAAVNQAKVWLQAFNDARHSIESYKKAKARVDMEKAAADAVAAQAAIDEIPGQMADSQRAAFLGKKDELLEKITGTLGKVLLASSALLEVHEKCMEMVGWLSKETTHVDELVEKFGPFAEIAHKVVAAYEGLSSSLTILRGGEGATEAEKETSRASAGLGVAGAAGSLTGLASAYMLYFGVVLSVGQKCLQIVGIINREHAHEFNTLLLATGDLNSVDWNAEPGGREAFDFMVKVMHAGSSVDIPTPVPKAVDELMVDSEDEFKAGTGEEVPTKGFWFWKHTNEDKLKYWLMNNRSNVWAMLYGSVSPPAG